MMNKLLCIFSIYMLQSCSSCYKFLPEPIEVQEFYDRHDQIIKNQEYNIVIDTFYYSHGYMVINDNYLLSLIGTAHFDVDGMTIDELIEIGFHKFYKTANSDSIYLSNDSLTLGVYYPFDYVKKKEKE